MSPKFSWTEANDVQECDGRKSRGKSVTRSTVLVRRIDTVSRRMKRGMETEERARRCELKRSEESLAQL
jgi:hypothetical protein